ncbi:hypothetical protein C8F04DRAFT_1258591 [Mycena alexandri]|uniref:Uncharacterized protein n=1 Tax=Mycena alexandri TaxID=1745969 RepID=A0AAD6SZK1_9AGAR|nr:hypothetical protein C8F04DRAFT_1258591 [Mycena alexandri]
MPNSSTPAAPFEFTQVEHSKPVPINASTDGTITRHVLIGLRLNLICLVTAVRSSAHVDIDRESKAAGRVRRHVAPPRRPRALPARLAAYAALFRSFPPSAHSPLQQRHLQHRVPLRKKDLNLKSAMMACTLMCPEDVSIWLRWAVSSASASPPTPAFHLFAIPITFISQPRQKGGAFAYSFNLPLCAREHHSWLPRSHRTRSYLPLRDGSFVKGFILRRCVHFEWMAARDKRRTLRECAWVPCLHARARAHFSAQIWDCDCAAGPVCVLLFGHTHIFWCVRPSASTPRYRPAHSTSLSGSSGMRVEATPPPFPSPPAFVLPLTLTISLPFISFPFTSIAMSCSLSPCAHVSVSFMGSSGRGRGRWAGVRMRRAATFYATYRGSSWVGRQVGRSFIRTHRAISVHRDGCAKASATAECALIKHPFEKFHMQPLADDIVVRLKEWLRTRILKSSFCRYTARRTDEDGSATHQREDWHGTPSSVVQV